MKMYPDEWINVETWTLLYYRIAFCESSIFIRNSVIVMVLTKDDGSIIATSVKAGT